MPAARAEDSGRHARLHTDQEAQKPIRPRPTTAATATEKQPITVPIMGEGIRSAKIVSLLKNPGDAIALDDALCEVETDKAVYPIESSFAGTMGEWKVEVGDTVEIGQELGTILVGATQPEKDVEAAVPGRWCDRQRATRPPLQHRPCAFPYDHAQTKPCHSREPANRRALGCYSQSA